ncbi:MAG TPA: hypothetical protein VFK79_08065 [Xanthobacteraceae bacterium]|nr:hypothetical protein [Xanthobacteraceae bacterium]
MRPVTFNAVMLARSCKRYCAKGFAVGVALCCLAGWEGHAAVMMISLLAAGLVMIISGIAEVAQ